MVSKPVQVQGVHKTPPLDKSSSGHLELGHNVKELCSGLSPTVSRKTNNNTQNMLSKWDMRVETIKLDVINST